MANYYNEIDPFAAAWLRALIAKGLIPEGEVDERSIKDVQPEDLRQFTQCHFFAGIAGWSYALHLAEWPVDRPIWTGSCPCQPFSVAGKGKGAADERHLWPEFHRLIRTARPPVVMGEQVAGKAGYDWFDGVSSDLEREGYAAMAVDIPACAVDAPHIRQRLYWVGVAHPESIGRRWRAHDQNAGRREQSPADTREGVCYWSNAEWRTGADGKTRRVKPGLCLLANGVPNRVGRLRGFGNAIVPPLAAEVIKALMDAGP